MLASKWPIFTGVNCTAQCSAWPLQTDMRFVQLVIRRRWRKRWDL